MQGGYADKIACRPDFAIKEPAGKRLHFTTALLPAQRFLSHRNFDLLAFCFVPARKMPLRYAVQLFPKIVRKDRRSLLQPIPPLCISIYKTPPSLFRTVIGTERAETRHMHQNICLIYELYLIYLKISSI